MPTMDDHGNVGGDGIRVDHDAWTPLPDHAKVTHVSVEPSKGGYTQGYM